MATTTSTLTEAAAHGSEAASHAGASSGMPQLDFSTFPNQIFWLVVTLVVIYVVLSTVALPRIADTLSERRRRITDDIAAAERLKNAAVEAEKVYNQALIDARAEAAKIVAAARAEVKSVLDQHAAEADAEIAAMTAESARRIDQIRAGAVATVEAVAKETAEAIVEAFAGSADPRSVAAAVGSRLKG